MDKQKIIELIDSNSEKAEKVISEKVKIWMEYEVFSGLWWMGAALSVLPWVIWIMVKKKQSTDRLLYVGLMIIVFSLCVDVLGDQFALWHYRFNVIPVMPTYLPWDLTLMPVSVMLLLQIKPKANPYLKAILFSLFASYAAEPFFQWLGVYNLHHWKYAYSVPVQFLLYLAAHYMLQGRNKFEKLPSSAP